MGGGLNARKLSFTRDWFREYLYDCEHKPRLAYARHCFIGSKEKDLDLEGLKEFYIDWRDYFEYIVLQKQTDNLRIKGEVDKETIAVKCAKRGNDVYWWRVGKRLKFLYALKDKALFDPHANVKKTNVLFVTLTFNIKISTIREAWETIGEEFNKWIRNLRKKKKGGIVGDISSSGVRIILDVFIGFDFKGVARSPRC